MDIAEFFQQSAGKWFSQRTGHYPAEKPTISGKSDLYIDVLATEDPTVARVCQSYGMDPALALCGLQIRWEGTVDGQVNKQMGSMVMVPIPNAETPTEGKLLREGKGIGTPAVVGRYLLDSNDVLTLIVDDGTTYSEERLWYLSPNLRLRTSVVKQSGGFSTAFFCSEIRLGAPKPSAS